MATKHQVIAMHRTHPGWTSGQIAEALGCDSAYVRSTFYRNGMSLPKYERKPSALQMAERERCAEIVRIHVADSPARRVVLARILGLE